MPQADAEGAGGAPVEPFTEWLRVLPVVDAATQAPGSRLTDAVEFVFQVDEASVFERMGEPDFDELTAYDEAQRDTAQAIVEGAQHEFPGLDLTVRDESIGRGAAGVAVAVVVVGATVVVPAVSAWLDVAERVASLWRWMRRRKEGAPTLSLGAVKYLCLADLARRLNGAVDDVVLVWSGDVGPGANRDLTYSGSDLFGLLFASPHGSWMYVVSDAGDVVVRTEGAPIPREVAFYAGLPFEDAPQLPALLDADDEDT